MKKIFLLLSALIFLPAFIFAQNIGIGTTSPAAKLDINGDIAFRSANIVISTTYNYALDVNTVKQANYKLMPTVPVIGNFIINGITSSVEGRTITLTNRTGTSMEIYNEDVNAIDINRIQTGTGNTVAVYPNGNVTLQYDATDQRWSIKSMHNNSLNYFGGSGGTSYWDLSGSNINNNNTGNVGIGTSNPFFKLDVNGNSRVKGNGLTGNGSGAGALEIETNDLPGTQSQFLNIDGQKIQSLGSTSIANPSSPKDLLLNPFGGKVGIGLTSPACKLTVLSNVVEANNNTNVFQIAGKNPVMLVSDFNGTNYGYIKGVTDNSVTPQFPLAGLEIGTVPGTDLFLSANYSPVLTVAQNNMVGIGTTAPTAPLSFDNILGNKISFWNNGANSDFGIGIQTGEMQFYTGGQDLVSFGYGSSNSYTRTMVYNTGTAQLGINCLPQAGYSLAVKGHIRSTEIVVETGWADYVFGKNYKLKPLTEVEEFIKQNNHLPNIPSAADIQKDGLKVGELQTKMMEKIEELTLYIIELKKEIDMLKAK